MQKKKVTQSSLDKQKTTERLLEKVLVSGYKRKDWVILECCRLRFLAVRVVDVGAILVQSEEFETKSIKFLCCGKTIFLLIKMFFDFFF